MAKKKWWINLVKNLLACNSQTNAEKGNNKRWKWFFHKFKLKQLPASTIQQHKSLSEAKLQQRKHALNVAKATAAAAQAALAAAQAAAEVVRLTAVSRSCIKPSQTQLWNLAAIKIQTAFRAYLARKALRALKGVVRIQALARGKAVRRQVSKIPRLIHSHSVHKKHHSSSCEIGEKCHSPRMTNEVVERLKLECKSQRQWTSTLFSKEELKSLYLKKHEAAFRRERMRQYSFSHRIAHANLFYGVLGGLGQFGIITRARIALEPAPKKVKWIRVLYMDFHIFTKDQEKLISADRSFDYIEGFVIINRTGLLNNWRSTFSPKDPLQASQLSSEGKTLYCLELAMYFNPDEANYMNQRMEYLLSRLNFISHTLFQSEVSYVDFLNRVHLAELKLREKGLWDVPHPWLNLLVPQSNIYMFAKEVFGSILTDTSNGPILIYPVNQSRWNSKTSLVTPEEDVFYLVAFLTSAMPSSTGSDGLEHILAMNRRIIDFCNIAQLGVKQYLPHYENEDGWKAHFGRKWDAFAQRKYNYDPQAILAPGQRIFHRGRATT